MSDKRIPRGTATCERNNNARYSLMLSLYLALSRTLHKKLQLFAAKMLFLIINGLVLFRLLVQ